MTTIRMEIEQVLEAANRLERTAFDLSDHGDVLKSTTERIASAWESDRADDFLHDLKAWLRNYSNLVENLQILGRRVSREVDQWIDVDENAPWKEVSDRMAASSRAGFYGLPAYGLAAAGAAGAVALGASAVTIGFHPVCASGASTAARPSWLEEHFTSEAGGGKEGSIRSYDPKEGWHREGLSWGAEAKAGVSGSLAKERYHSWGNWDVGAKAGVGEEGFSAGLYAEGSVFSAERSRVFGSSMFGFTMTGAAEAGSVSGFAGIKDNDIGASIGGSLASGELGLGFNVLGFNARLRGGLAAGLEAGLKIGDDTEAKLGPFSLGLSFGKAIVETP